MNIRRRTLFALAVALVVALVALLGRFAVHNTERTGESSFGAASTSESSNGPSDERVIRAVAQATKFPITGAVQVEGGDTIAAALVCLSRGDEQPGKAPSCLTTSKDGSFSFNVDAAGSYLLVASAAQHQPASLVVTPDEFRAHPDGLDVILRLKTGGVVVAGSVVDASGGVIAGARLFIRARYDETFLMAAETDSEGQFQMFAPSGRVELGAEADGYSRTIADIVAPNERVKIALTAGARITGRVVEQNGKRTVGGVNLVARKRGGIVFGYGAARSNEKGQFEISGLAPGDYEVAVEDANWVGEPTSAIVAMGEATTDVVLSVTASGSLQGQILVNNEPCSHGEVTLHSSRDFGAVAAPNGAVRFSSIPAGEFGVEVACQGAVGLTERLTVNVGENSPRLWKLTSGLRIAGRVVSTSGKAQGGVSVRVEHLGGTDDSASRGSHAEPVNLVACQTDQAGAFECGGLQPGSYRCTAGNGDLVLAEPVTVSLKDQSIDSLELRIGNCGAIRAQITKTGGGAIGSTTVYATMENGYLLRANRQSDGDYLFSQVPIGKYGVFAGNIKNKERARPVVIERDGQEASVQIELALDATLKGRVIDENGQAVPDAWVSVEDPQSMSLSAQDGKAPTLTDERGEFEIIDLEPGVYRVKVEAANGEAVIDSAATGTSVNLRVNSYAVVLGNVRNASGQAVPNFSLEYRQDYTSHSMLINDQNGVFKLSRLRPGTWTFTVTSPEGFASRDVTVAPSGRSKVSLTLQRIAQRDPQARYGQLAQDPGGGV